jgi:ribosome-associated protein
MDIRKLQRAIVDGLEDVKAQDILVFNTEHLSPLFERVIVASGASNRQTKALASSVRVAVKEAGLTVLRTEGEDNGEWIIVDCGAAVAHIMQPAIRDYYRLEEIWGGKPVKVKLGDGKVGLVKASEDEEEDEAPAKKPAARKTAAKPAPMVEARPAPRPAAKKVAPAKATPTAGTVAGRAALAKAAAAPAAKRPAPARKISSGVTTAAKMAAAVKAAGMKPGAAKKTAVAPAKEPKLKTIVVKPVAKKAAATSTRGKAPAKPARKTAR